jgi:hypothetical protein
MDFTPSHRLQSRLVPQPDVDAAASALPIPIFVAVKRRRGLRQYPRCVFRGFYDPENARQRPQIWSHDEATIDCCFPASTKLRYVWLEIGSTSPRGATLDLYVNDQLVAHQRRIRGRTTVCAKLLEACVVTCMSIRIVTTTFVPGDVLAGSEDRRELGVALRAVVFGKRKTKYRPGTYRSDPFGRRIVHRVFGWLGRRVA